MFCWVNFEMPCRLALGFLHLVKCLAAATLRYARSVSELVKKRIDIF